MKEPILSREEVEAIAHRICARYIHSENIHLRQYTFGITTLEQLVDAILESVCGGGAVANMFPSDLERFKTSETFAQAYSVAVGNPDEHSVPLYALNRSKA